ncbi:MAG: hypothetical protein EKK60_14935 [Gordonia sp. (in: high G+C Gram-positive bacteria)]|nr:MAG: hypothetical protein EKK60_14935 [Gordonia sp. (in: high G+C Gram-positive bacteria)]
MIVIVNALAVLLTVLATIGVPVAHAAPAVPGWCSPSVMALGYSDALDKRTYGGETVAGL